MKKVTIFWGENSFGKHYELVRHNGQNGSEFYIRDYIYNGYGMGWGKFRKVNDFNGKITIDENGKEQISWGFGIITNVGEGRRKIE
jgi:hypothetical protein